jgi:dipeptidyl aminopeptidase/acylaminoacyl peptidase
VIARPAPIRACTAALAGAAVAAGCASPRIELDELPPRPIAVAYWDADTARDRAERRAEREAGGVAPKREGVATAGALAGLFGLDRHARDAMPGRLALVDPATGEATALREATPGAIPLAWSAECDCLLFSSTQRGGRQLFEWNRETGEVRQLTHADGQVAHADYGPGGRVVYALIESRGGGARACLWIADPGGAAARRLTEGPADHSPTWSPDGSTIVFVREDPQQGTVLVARPPEPGGAERVLGRGEQPVFSRAGDWVVYVARMRDGRRLWRIRPDGSGKLPVGRGQSDERMPAISPDGRYVAFVAEEEHRERLYVRRIDGSGERLLLEDGDGAWPAW